MKLSIHANSSLKVTKAMRNYITDAVEAQLEDVIPDDSLVSCTCKVSKDEQSFEIMVTNKEYKIRAESRCENLYDAIDDGMIKISKSARKYHQKMLDIKKRSNKKVHDIYEEMKDSYTDEKEKDRIIREKKINVVAMSVESAMLQMETLDHDFFLFLDSESLNPCVIYKRNEGGFGLIKSV